MPLRVTGGFIMRKVRLLILAAVMMLLLCSCSCRHEIVIDEAVPAGCLTSGLTEGQHCSKCGEVLQAQEEIPALGHSYVLDDRVEPDCTHTGLTPGFHCTGCDEVFVPQEVIPALGHVEQTDEAIAPTCLETGLTEGVHCVTCGEVLVPQEEIPANGHRPHVVTEAEFPRTFQAIPEGIVCDDCGAVFFFLTDEAANEFDREEMDNGCIVTREMDHTWGLLRICSYTPEDTLISVAIVQGDNTLASITYFDGGEQAYYCETVQRDSDVHHSTARYTLDCQLESVADHYVDDQDRIILTVSYNSEGNEISRMAYDLNAAGECVRTRLETNGNLYYLLLSCEPDTEYVESLSSYWEITPYEIGLLVENGEQQQTAGFFPRKSTEVEISIVDWLTGETVQTVDPLFGMTAFFDELLDGFYYYQVTCEGYTQLTSPVYRVCSADAKQSVQCFAANLEKPGAEFEEPVTLTVVDAEGKPLDRQKVLIGVRRNNSSERSAAVTLDTGRDGQVCFIVNDTNEGVSTDSYLVAQFHLRVGCVLEYTNSEGKVVSVIMDGSEEIVIQY